MALMDEDALLIESILREDAKLNGYPFDDDSEWKTVSYPRRQRKQQQQQTSKAPPPAELSTGQDVFRSVDSHADERRRRVVEDQRAALQAVTGSKELSAGEDSGDDSDGAAEANDVAPVKKMKAKKAKKPKVSVIEAASKIDANDLAAFLIDISGSYESQEDIRLMRFADIFGRAFASVGSAQFPWMKMLKDSTVSKMVDELSLRTVRGQAVNRFDVAFTEVKVETLRIKTIVPMVVDIVYFVRIGATKADHGFWVQNRVICSLLICSFQTSKPVKKDEHKPGTLKKKGIRSLVLMEVSLQELHRDEGGRRRYYSTCTL